MPSAVRPEQLVLAWAILLALGAWSYLWKCIALWKAARRDQTGWYVVLALAPTLGLLEMFYVFLVAPRVADLGEV